MLSVVRSVDSSAIIACEGKCFFISAIISFSLALSTFVTSSRRDFSEILRGF